MNMNLGKFIHTERGRIIMSILLGFGLASLFRKVCKGNNCLAFHAPPLDEFKDKIYKNNNGKCIKYTPIATKCLSNSKIISFE
jgi:hypothetical protein